MSDYDELERAAKKSVEELAEATSSGLYERIAQLEADNEKLLGVIEYLEDSPQGKLAKEIEALQRQVEGLPGIKIADGTVWLVFPGAIISIDAIMGGRGPIVKKNLRAWRDNTLEAGDDLTPSTK